MDQYKWFVTLARGANNVSTMSDEKASSTDC